MGTESMGVRSNILPALGDQPFIGQMLSIDDTAKGVNKDVVIVPIAETPFQFIQVSVNVLSTDLVECPDDAPLEQGPNALYGVGVNVTNGPLLSRVVDGFMSGVLGCT